MGRALTGTGRVGAVGVLGGVDGEVDVGAEGVVGVVGAVAVVTAVSGASWLGGGVMVAFGLQLRNSASIRISATKILRFILTPTLVGDSYRHWQPGNRIIL